VAHRIATGGKRFRAAAIGPRAQISDRGPQREHSGNHAAWHPDAGEKALAMSPEGAAQVRSSINRCSITPPTRCGRRSKESTGAEVREATAEIEPTTGTVVKVFTTGTVVQVFLLASDVARTVGGGNELAINP